MGQIVMVRRKEIDVDPQEFERCAAVLEGRDDDYIVAPHHAEAEHVVQAFGSHELAALDDFGPVLVPYCTDPSASMQRPFYGSAPGHPNQDRETAPKADGHVQSACVHVFSPSHELCGPQVYERPWALWGHNGENWKLFRCGDGSQ